MDQSSSPTAVASSCSLPLSSVAPPAQTEWTLDIIRTMRKQEETTYKRGRCNRWNCVCKNIPGDNSNVREAMVNWCYRTAEANEYDKECVELALLLNDRFICLRSNEGSANNFNEVNESLDFTSFYQLSCITCMYISSKTNVGHLNCLTADDLSRLSGDRFYPEQIEAMERDIVATLDWNLNPPTAISFVRQLVDLIEIEHLEDTKEEIFTVVETQIQLAIENDLSASSASATGKASTLGFAALMNYLEQIVDCPTEMMYCYLTFVNALGVDEKSFKSTLEGCRKELHDLVMECLEESDSELSVEFEETTTSLPPPPPPKEIIDESPRSVLFNSRKALTC